MKSKYNKFWDNVLDTILAIFYYGMIGCLIYVIIAGCSKLNNHEIIKKTKTHAILNESNHRARIRTYK